MYSQADRGLGTSDLSSPVSPATANLAELIELLPDAPRGILRPTAPLFDREPDLERLCALIAQPEARLVTVTGPGGVGKTRLALEAASRVATHFPDGVMVISLAPIRDPAHVLPAIARVAGIHIADISDMGSQLIANLHEQRTLIVLDNCEQVLDAAPGIAQLLNGCPHLSALATSRAPMRIVAEHLFQTAPLSVGVSPLSIDEPAPGAVQLFVSRARQADAQFSLDERNVGAIQEICRRLDGLPLAIELAAARINSLSPHDLLARLEPRLPMLTQGSRDLPERQQTMRATIAWSYELLSERDRRVFRWISVFVGGFRLRSGEAVIASLNATFGHAPLTDAELVEAIAALIASSLIHKAASSDRESRYAMLEVVREFGLELLESHNELTVASRAHAGWYASNREWLDPNRFPPNQTFIDHLWAIDAEQPNILAALSRSAALGDALRVLEIAANTSVFWHHRGFLGEGRTWLEHGLRSASDVPPETRAWALAGLGLIQWTQGDAAGADPWLREAHAIAEALEHTELQALTLHLLALVDIDLRRIDEARTEIETALALWQRLELPSDEAMALSIIGFLPPAPDTDDRRTANAHHALSIFESIGHTSGIAFCLLQIGSLAQQEGDERRMIDFYSRAVSLWLGIDERWAIARPIAMLSEFALQHGHPREAATLLGFMDTRLGTSNATLNTWHRSIAEKTRATLIEQMGGPQFHEAREAGTRLSASEIEALIARLKPQMSESALLTRREREVLQRIAAGATDREIADNLFVSPRTVHTHVSHILAKLDVASRREAVQRAQELGLLDPQHAHLQRPGHTLHS